MKSTVSVAAMKNSHPWFMRAPTTEPLQEERHLMICLRCGLGCMRIRQINERIEMVDHREVRHPGSRSRKSCLL